MIWRFAPPTYPATWRPGKGICPVTDKSGVESKALFEGRTSLGKSWPAAKTSSSLARLTCNSSCDTRTSLSPRQAQTPATASVPTARDLSRAVDRVLADKAGADRSPAKHGATAIKEIYNRKAAVEKEFDEKLAKLGYRANSGKPKRSYHKKAANAPGADAAAKTKAKDMVASLAERRCGSPCLRARPAGRRSITPGEERVHLRYDRGPLPYSCPHSLH